MNKTLSSLTALSLVAGLQFACGGTGPELDVVEANAAPDPRRPTPGIYINCRPVFDWLNDVQPYELAYITTTYTGDTGSATNTFYAGNQPLASGNVFAFGDIELQGAMLADTLDFSISGIQPTRGTFHINRPSRVAQSRGGPIYVPGIIGPSATGRPVSKCELVDNSYDDYVLIDVPAPDDNGLLTIEVHQYFVGG